ncbi:MAG TPA: cache domain-containing protein [Methanothrix sp.]|nr:cache domain-containing protein [Methanothrix sp.]HPJ83682.1 cache domain-containing protein [Methanothrix sp.]HPR66465.1 cache domain-containing protein [Methanothrix sp.]
MIRSRNMPKLFALMVATVALTTFLVPAAFAEDAMSSEPNTDWDLMWSFVQATDSVSANLAEIDRSLLDASLALSGTGIEGQEARTVLDDLVGIGPWVVDCITVDLNGTIVEVVPEEYQEVRGTSIKDQEHIERLLSTGRPVGLAYIMSVEGFYAMDFASPIFDGEGRLIGAVTALVNSTELFGTALAPYQPGGRAEIWAMMPDGTIIYDSDAEQIGRNTFTDPLFQPFSDLLAVAERVKTERSGKGSYEISGRAREVFWTTVDYQGEEIRILLSVDA